jgi:hypothetical protein
MVTTPAYLMMSAPLSACQGDPARATAAQMAVASERLVWRLAVGMLIRQLVRCGGSFTTVGTGRLMLPSLLSRQPHPAALVARVMVFIREAIPRIDRAQPGQVGASKGNGNPCI